MLFLGNVHVRCPETLTLLFYEFSKEKKSLGYYYTQLSTENLLSIIATNSFESRP